MLFLLLYIKRILFEIGFINILKTKLQIFNNNINVLYNQLDGWNKNAQLPLKVK